MSSQQELSDVQAEPLGVRRFAAEELESALPRKGRQVRGFDVVSQCRLVRKICENQQDRGFLWVGASDKPNTWKIYLAVVADTEPGAARSSRRNCTNAAANRPLKWTDRGDGSYFPGFRGSVKRSDWSYLGWRGFVCTTRGVSLWPDGEQSEEHVSTRAQLFNDFHSLTTSGRNERETKALAREYLDRLID